MQSESTSQQSSAPDTAPAPAGVPAVVTPFVIWLPTRDEMPFVADQRKETINFQITICSRSPCPSYSCWCSSAA